MNIRTLKTELKGRIFSATFIKKDGTIRKINCRLGVVKALRGGALKYNAEACNNLVVYDLQAKDYRTINIDKLIALRYNKKELVGENGLALTLE